MPRPILQATAIAAILALVPIGTSAMAAVDSQNYREFGTFFGRCSIASRPITSIGSTTGR